MDEIKLITKFQAWMDLYGDDKNNYDMESSTNKEGKQTYKMFVPMLEKEITSVGDGFEEVFYALLENISKEIDEFILDKPDIRDNLESQMKYIEEESKRKEREYIEKHNQKDDYGEFLQGIDTYTFNKDVETVINNLSDFISNSELYLCEGPSKLYCKVLSKDYFGTNLSKEEIINHMEYLCREDFVSARLMALFIKCVIVDNYVLAIGVTEYMDL